MHHPNLTAQDLMTGLDQPVAEHHSRPALAADAREAVRVFLTGLGPAVATQTAQHLLLLVSELVTNALRHAGAVTALRLRADRHRLTVTVEDPDPAPPRERVPDLSGSEGGFGWPMVLRMSDEVRVLPAPAGGKTVIATLAR
ncbi:ATP-binding protein [Streptomyces sp. NPDC007088]|uniref:ATP-binding protein n=1 Tax=Streptomyces sp. NPDC007088 TaxID=3364773 RepID=UPI0036C67E2C